MSVAPDPNPEPFPYLLSDEILFDEINVRTQSTKIIVMHGLGTKLNNGNDTANNKITLCNYASKGIFKDALTLMKDLKNTNSKTTTRRERLDGLITAIQESLANPKYTQVILIGFSHGSMIMYAALVEIEANIDIPCCQLKKLRFYAVSPPTFFPANTLSYNRLVNTLPFAHLQYQNDPFYNKCVKFEGTVNNILMKIAKKKVIHLVSNYYDKIKRMTSRKPPTNKCFFYDSYKQTLFLLPFPEKVDFPEEIGHRYRVASRLLKGNTHAHTAMLYPFMVFFEIATAIIQNVAGGSAKYVNILGRRRKTIVKGRWTYVKYNGQLITLNTAHKLQTN